jgi:hypothetical protein
LMKNWPFWFSWQAKETPTLNTKSSNWNETRNLAKSQNLLHKTVGNVPWILVTIICVIQMNSQIIYMISINKGFMKQTFKLRILIWKPRRFFRFSMVLFYESTRSHDELSFQT